MRRTFSVGFGVAVLSAMAGVSHGQQAVQWRVQDGGNGHWYMTQRSAEVISWKYAASVAQSSGGYLATLDREGENQFVFSVAQSQSGWTGLFGPWLGGYAELKASKCDLGSWQWITGEVWQTGLAAWCSGQPDCAGGPTDESYLHYWTCGAGWNNASESGQYGWGGVHTFMVEWSADCDGNGVVDYGEILDGTLRDANANGIPDCCEGGQSCGPCDGDLNDDNATNGADLSVLLGFWGLSGKSVLGDIDGNLVVDAADLSLLLASWGPCP
jgi:hypothetical protein